MKRFGMGYVAGLVLLAGAGEAAGFELNLLGQAGGWDDVTHRPAITAVLDASDYTSDLEASQISAALTDAFHTWDGVAGATNLDFVFRRDNGRDFDMFDGVVESKINLRFANIVVGGFLPESYFTALDPQNGAGILAVTWVTPFVHAQSGNIVWETELFFNDAWNWTNDMSAAAADFGAGLPNKLVDVQTVALHEIGHALGLGHEDGDDSTMASSYMGPRRGLFQADLDVVTQLYGEITAGRGASLESQFDSPYLLDVMYASDPANASAPEPGAFGLLLLGAALAGVRRRSDGTRD